MPNQEYYSSPHSVDVCLCVYNCVPLYLSEYYKSDSKSRRFHQYYTTQVIFNLQLIYKDFGVECYTWVTTGHSHVQYLFQELV